MKNTFRAALAMVTLALLTAAIVTVRADAPKTETVSFPNGTGAVSGFLATPDKPGHYPALVVIHEWWGLTDWVKEQTQKLAEQGYVALAVDLYRGQVTSDPEVAHELMRGLPAGPRGQRSKSGVRLPGHAQGRGSRAHRLDRLVHGRRIFAATGDSRAAPGGVRGESTARCPPIRTTFSRSTRPFSETSARTIAALRRRTSQAFSRKRCGE